MRTRVMVEMAAILALCACANGPAGLLNEATGSMSQTLCSKTFVSGLPADEVMRDHLLPEPGMGAIAWGLHYDIDREGKNVRTTVFSGSERTAEFKSGRGCTLRYPGVPAPAALRSLPHAPALLPDIAGADVVTPQDRRLVAALDAAFAEPSSGPPRNTQAVVVVRGGRVIAERYAAGIGPDTPLLSHSMAKSLVNALIGVRVREGALNATDKAPVAAWKTAADAHANITIDNLLRMNAGFGFDEGSGASTATHIWYTKPDMAAAAAAADLKSAPGAAWGYCSRCFITLSRILGDSIGGGPQGLSDFAHRQVFDPLGMHSVTLEFDPTGTMMGANAVLAAPRDWARFGLLYLHDGVVGDRRILPEGWVKYSTTPTGANGYGAGFWLNTTDASIPEWHMKWGIPGAPRDAFMARGYMGQYTVIVPSADLVIVRMGQSHGRNAEIASVGKLVADVIAATPRTPAAAP